MVRLRLSTACALNKVQGLSVEVQTGTWYPSSNPANLAPLHLYLHHSQAGCCLATQNLVPARIIKAMDTTSRLRNTFV